MVYMENIKFFKLSSFIGSVLMMLAIHTNGQLMKSNSLGKIPKNQKEISVVQLKAPMEVNNIEFQKISLDSNLLGKNLDQSYKIELRLLEENFSKLEENTILNKMKINELKGQPKKGTNETKQEIEKLTQLNKKNEMEKDSIKIAMALMEKRVSQQDDQLKSQIDLKRSYRNKYYAVILKNAKENWDVLNENARTYNKIIDATLDTLSTSKWLLYSSNSDTMVRENGKLYSELLIETTEIKFALSDLQKDYSLINENLKKFEQIETLLQHNLQNEQYIDSLFNTYAYNLQNSFEIEKKHNDLFKIQYDKYRNNFISKLKDVSINYEKNKPKIKNNSTDGSVLADFTQPLNANSSLIPSINIFASNKFGSEDLSIMGQAKLFLAAPGSDSNSLSNAVRYFIPEASQFGFMTDITFGFIPSRKDIKNDRKILGINLSLYYLQKQLNEKKGNNDNFNVSVLQTRVGLELVCFRNAISVYMNLYGQYLGKGVEKYQENYINKNGMQFYSEYGIKSYLNLAKDAEISILLDMRFIPVNNYIKEFTGLKDKFIPLFKLGIVKDFDF